MSTFDEVIHLIEQQVCSRRARCVIVDEGFPDESSLFGTRDGYLNLALTLLRFVADVDSGRRQMEEGRYAFDDHIKAVMYQLPTHSAWLVGTVLFKSHAEFMAALSRLVDPQIEGSLLNDPQFNDL